MADTFVPFTKEKLATDAGVADLNRVLQLLFNLVGGDADTVKIYSGFGSPLNVVAAGVGSLYLRYDGGAGIRVATGTTLYVKESGTDATGWNPL